MTPIDTAALRAAAEDAEQAAYAVSVSLHPATVRALCDGYDEAQRLRELLRKTKAAKRRVGRGWDAERERFAALVADLRALAARLPESFATRLDAVIDRHAPGTTTEEGR